MKAAEIAGVVTRVYAAAGRRAADVEFEVWGEALADLLATPEQVHEATVVYVRETDFQGAAPTPSGYRKALLTILQRDRMRAPAIDADLEPTPLGKKWIGRIREGLDAIGRGGVPKEQRLHTADDWVRCAECKRVAKEIASSD